MDKIAGPYVNTLTSILGDKRSTMLESELQHKVGISRLLHLACSCTHTNDVCSTVLPRAKSLD